MIALLFASILFIDMPDNKTTKEYGIKRERTLNLNLLAQAVRKYFGKNPVVEAAMYGNSSVETGGSYKHDQKQYGGGGGYGVFQFDKPHKGLYREYLKEEGLPDNSDSQVRYVYENIYGKKQNIMGAGNAKQLREAFQSDDPEFVSDQFMELFLRPGKPHRDRRVDATKKYYEQLINRSDAPGR